MTYQTILNSAMNWLSADLDNLVLVAATVAVIGALNGVRCSFNRCKGGHIGRRVI